MSDQSRKDVDAVIRKVFGSHWSPPASSRYAGSTSPDKGPSGVICSDCGQEILGDVYDWPGGLKLDAGCYYNRDDAE